MRTLFKNPMTRKRLMRFKSLRRAYFSFWILAVLYALSLCAEMICNSAPLYVHFQGNSYFPVFHFYPEDEFTGSGRQTRPDYHKISRMPQFSENENNYMVFPPFPHGPYRSVDPDTIKVPDVVTLVFTPIPRVGTVNIGDDFSIRRSVKPKAFTGVPAREIKNRRLGEFFEIPEDVREAVMARFANRSSPAMSRIVRDREGRLISLSLSTYKKRERTPRSIRLTMRFPDESSGKDAGKSYRIQVNRDLARVQPSGGRDGDLWPAVSEDNRREIMATAANRFSGPVDDLKVAVGGRSYVVAFDKQDVRFPFRPVKEHLMGIDRAGRDVLARILYGMRTSMTFGLLLVLGSMGLGIAAGAVQGYYGGLVDISGQRIIEIWSALPFLYVMILMGSIYGRSFILLLVCYGLFNWIGISYYIRAEFLRLRGQPFVEAARCMGVPSRKIIFKHILPNGMIPVVTFFPFSLVGAIGSLAALDYLGFGLPPPTPSWGELLFQAQQYRWAWWLILYPSLALFLVMLLGVFVGEGIRNAYDPKQYTRLE